MPGSRTSTSLMWWPHTAIHTGGSGSAAASRKACASESDRGAPAGGWAQPNTTTRPAGACGLTPQIAPTCGQHSLRWRAACAATRAVPAGTTRSPSGVSTTMTNSADSSWLGHGWELHWVHPASGRDGAHGPLLCGGSLATARLDPTPGAWSHQSGLGLVSTERERGGSVVGLLHSGHLPRGIVGGDPVW